MTFVKRALQVHPSCPGAIRLGIGLCRYKLGQLGKARQAFQRALQLDPENVEALVALAVMDLQANEAAGIRKGMEKMQRAFEIYPYCAMALNYLANHFFFTGQHFLVEQLTETALAVTNHGPTKSHSYYNLARSYHSKDSYNVSFVICSTASCPPPPPPQIITWVSGTGLGQVQLKLGDFRSALTNFEKVLEIYPDNCETLKALGHIYVQLGQIEKAQELLRKAAKIDPRDAQAFIDLGELLISSDTGAALDAFKTARTLLKKAGEEVPIEVLNNIGVIHFEKGEFEHFVLCVFFWVMEFVYLSLTPDSFDVLVVQSAHQSFKDALGDGIWLTLLDSKTKTYVIDASASMLQFKDMQLFHRFENDGNHVELPWNKVTVLFNLARLLEQIHDTVAASVLYRLILFKVDYVDAYLRLAAIAKARNNLQLSIELVNEALKVNGKYPNALSMLGDLELKNDDWVKAKETFRAASDATDGKDSYATLSLLNIHLICLVGFGKGNWNYFAALRNEKRAPKLEATHLEKAKELYTRDDKSQSGSGSGKAKPGLDFAMATQVIVQHTSNLYAANGAGVVLAEKGQFDVSKDLFTQVQEAASGSVFVQMPDVWINLAHVYFAQGNFALAMKMYQNCLRKFYYNTDAQILLYLARTHYEAEQWQDCKKSLLRAIHLAPSNYTLRFDAGVAMQKFSASTLQKTRRTADEVRSTVAELENAVRVFSHLSAASNLHLHGFDEKKINTHVEYCKHLLDAAKIHREAAEREEQQNRQRQEAARQAALAEEARRKAEEQKKYLEQWRSSTPASKRRERSENDDDEVGHSEKRRRKGGKRRKKDKSSRSHYETEYAEADMMDYREEPEDEDASMNYREPIGQMNDQDDDVEENANDRLAAAGLEDSDVDDEMAPSITAARRRQALSESDDDEPFERQLRDNTDELQDSDGELRENDHKSNGGAALDDD
ncbi:protein CTR9-like [Citrus sinensis]|uniref:Protein CTR9-like n=1 Tax=Citrus sinensis TaxID=2711 RepID=A0ACB8NVM4_CITSI|nr:protein CTR9-like [Citrus sinensis]